MTTPPANASSRVDQFRRLIDQDPKNDMAYFSLGGALRDAGQIKDAADAYLKCVELNPGMSKAYQLAGECLLEAGERERAAETLKLGYTTASERGDTMPKQAIEVLLQTMNEPLPQTGAAAAPAAPTGDFTDAKTGKPGTRLPRPPFRGPVGEWIAERISQESWNEWIGLGTKVINELRLDLSKDEDSAVYDYGMRRFVGLNDETHREITGRDPENPDPRYMEVLDDILKRGGHLEDFQGEMHTKM